MSEQPTTITEIADILDRAADHIDTVGWYRGSLYDGEQSLGTPLARCRVCALGAINVAIHGSPVFPIGRAGEGIGAHDVAGYVDRRRTDGAELADWNDDVARTQAEVTAALRDTAAELRGAV